VAMKEVPVVERTPPPSLIFGDSIIAVSEQLSRSPDFPYASATFNSSFAGFNASKRAQMFLHLQTYVPPISLTQAPLALCPLLLGISLPTAWRRSPEPGTIAGGDLFGPLFGKGVGSLSAATRPSGVFSGSFAGPLWQRSARLGSTSAWLPSTLSGHVLHGPMNILVAGEHLGPGSLSVRRDRASCLADETAPWPPPRTGR